MEVYRDASNITIAVQFVDSDGDSFLFDINTPYTMAVSTPDGEGFILQGSTIATYFSLSGQQSYVDTSADSSAGNKLRRDYKHAAVPRDAASSITVQLTLTDTCGKHLKTPNVQLDCTQLAYQQENAGSGPPAVLQVTPEIMDGDGNGVYIGACDISSELAAYAAYTKCVNESNQNLQPFCGIDLTDVNKASGFLNKIGKSVPAIKAFMSKLGSAIGFWNKACKFLTNPIIVKQLDYESCGYPQELGLGFEGVGFSSGLGTVTPTTAAGQVLATSAVVPATTSCTTSTSTTSAACTASPTYLPQTYGSDFTCGTYLVSGNSGYFLCRNCWVDTSGVVYDVICSCCTENCCTAITNSDVLSGLDGPGSGTPILGSGCECSSPGFGEINYCNGQYGTVTPDQCTDGNPANFGCFLPGQPQAG